MMSMMLDPPQTDLYCYSALGILLSCLYYYMLANESAIERRKRHFLQESGHRYGYKDSKAGHIDNWRKRELPSLIGTTSMQDKKTDVVYLDYAGAGLPVNRQLRRITQDATLLANPHSIGPLASATKRMIDSTKVRVLRHFCGEECAHEYDVIFTAGTTAGLKLVGENFPFSAESHFVYTHNSHTSVVGVRNMAHQGGADCQCVDMDKLMSWIGRGDGFLSADEEEEGKSTCSTGDEPPISLLCCPLECNFKGDVADVKRIAQAFRTQQMDSYFGGKQTKWVTMADIAKAAATGPVDLPALGVDLACLSFYKMFGEPTGLGAVIGKRDTLKLLLKQRQKNVTSFSYFGGGTVDALLPSEQGFNPAREAISSAFTDGTVHFRGIASLKAGFDELDLVGGIAAIKQHCLTLKAALIRRFQSMRHYSNGNPVVRVYSNLTSPSSIVTFNVLRPDGSYVGYAEVSKLAELNRPSIQLRTGCFCNVGACQKTFNLSNSDIKRNLSRGHRCGDELDIIDGQPTGAIRVSVGKDSIWEDIDALVCFLETTYCQARAPEAIMVQKETVVPPSFDAIYVYPIKSCSGILVDKNSGWPFDTKRGVLLFDREWAVVDSEGTVLRLSTQPNLSRVLPELDLVRRTLTLRTGGSKDDYLEMNIDNDGSFGSQHVSVCGAKCSAAEFGNKRASDWLTRVVGVRCFLVRHSSNSDNKRDASIYFANESPILVVSQDSVNTLNKVLKSRGDPVVDARHFRPNFVISGGTKSGQLSPSSGENSWEALSIGEVLQFAVTGPCSRCSMVDIDPTSGARNGSTLRALASHTRHKNRIFFGVFCKVVRVAYSCRDIIHINTNNIVDIKYIGG